MDRQRSYAPRDGSVTIEEGDWEVSADDVPSFSCASGRHPVTAGDLAVVPERQGRRLRRRRGDRRRHVQSGVRRGTGPYGNAVGLFQGGTR